MKDYTDYVKLYYVWSTVESFAYLAVFLVPFVMAISMVNWGLTIIDQDPIDVSASISHIIERFQTFLGIMTLTVASWVASGLALHHLTDFYVRLGRAVDEFTSDLLPGILRVEARKYLANSGKSIEVNQNLDEWSQQEYMKGKKSEFYRYALPNADKVFRQVKAKHGATSNAWSSIMGVTFLATLVIGLAIVSIFP